MDSLVHGYERKQYKTSKALDKSESYWMIAATSTLVHAYCGC